MCMFVHTVIPIEYLLSLPFDLRTILLISSGSFNLPQGHKYIRHNKN